MKKLTSVPNLNILSQKLANPLPNVSLHFLIGIPFNKQLKRIEKKFFFDKTQNNDLFISPKRKIPVLEMALKSFNISKLDYQTSKSWKKSAAHELKTTSKLDRLKNWVPDCSAQGGISAKSF